MLFKLKGLPKSNRSSAKYPQGTGRIRKAAKPQTAALRVRFEKEEQQNERALTFVKIGASDMSLAPTLARVGRLELPASCSQRLPLHFFE